MSVGDSKPTRRIAVIGGGISGLAAAHRITELLPHAELVLFEASGRLGGVLETVERDGFLVERSADSFITKYPWATELCQRIGLADQLVPTDETRRRALVVRHGELLPVPRGFVLMTANKAWPILTTRVLSWRGKLRLLAEPFVPRRDASGQGDESVGSFATAPAGRRGVRAIGAAAVGRHSHFRRRQAEPGRHVSRVHGPGGILRPHSTRRKQGSIAHGERRTLQLVCRAARRHRQPRCRSRRSAASGCRAAQFIRRRAGTNRRTANGESLCTAVEEVFDAVIVALPAPAAASLLATVDAELSAELAAIEYAGCAVVCLAYRRDQFGRPPEGFGFVVPRIENRQIIAASFASEKFPGRAPPDEVLIRVFIGGALAPELAELSDGRAAIDRTPRTCRN